MHTYYFFIICDYSFKRVLLRGMEGEESELDLYGLQMGDVGVAQLAAALAQNTSVKVLNLSCNRIGAEGAEKLAISKKQKTSTGMPLPV